jgi:hypothetical protein
MMVKELLELYEKSHFDAFVPADRVLSEADRARAVREYERDPVAALVANVNQARSDVRATQSRFLAARQDGLFDRDGFRAATKEERRRWVAAIDTIRGDVSRARSELEHWRGYVRWATEEQEAKVSRLEASVPDPRLPPERDDDEAELAF